MESNEIENNEREWTAFESGSEYDSGDSLESDILIEEHAEEASANQFRFDSVQMEETAPPQIYALPLPTPNFPWDWTHATTEVRPIPRDPIIGHLASQVLCRPKPLSGSLHSSPVKLFTETFWGPMRSQLLTSTMDYIETHPELNTNGFTLTRSDLDTYFSYSMLLSLFKPPSLTNEAFINNVEKIVKDMIPLDPRLKMIKIPETFKKMTVKKYDFISKVLDLGKNEKVVRKDLKGYPILNANGETVRIYDLNKKFTPFQNNMNHLFRLFKNPENPTNRENDKILSFDETFRESKSKKDQLRCYMPNKPKKYGQKYYSVVDQDTYCHRFTLQLPPQFKRWIDLLGLMQVCVPGEFFGKGFSFVMDNYFSSAPVLKYFNDNDSSMIATWRRNRVSKLFEPALFREITRRETPTNFIRKVETYYTTTIGRPIQFTFFSDKPSKNCVILSSNDVNLHKKGGQNKRHNMSELLPGGVPNLVKFYNKFMGAVDSLDQQLRYFTVFRKYQNGRWIRRLIDSWFDIIVHNCKILNKIHQAQYGDDEMIKLIKNGRFARYFHIQLALGLVDGGPKETVNNGLNPGQFIPWNDGKLPKRKYCQSSAHSSTTKTDRPPQTRFECSVCKMAVCGAVICRTCFDRTVTNVDPTSELI